MIQTLIGPIGNLVGTWLQGKVDKSKVEIEAPNGVMILPAKTATQIHED